MASGVDPIAGLHVLGKARAVIDAVADSPGMSVAALAERVDEPVSSMYRLLASLTALRWLERGESRGEYRLGTRFIWFGDRFEAHRDLRAAALPSLRLLNEQTGQTAFLCVRNDTSATCIERIDGQDVQIQRLHLGGSLPLHEGASPCVLLAYSAEDFRATYLDTLPAGPIRDGTTAEVIECRERGYALADDEIAVGVRSVGAPIFDHRGDVVAAISISGLRDRGVVDSVATVHLVVDEAARISALLGGHTELLEAAAV